MDKKRIINDSVLIGDWEEVSGLQLSTITKRDEDTQHLDGIVIKGYETKFGKTNENGERYDEHCLDKFIDEYFIANKLNMVVDLQHSTAIDDQVGRVIYLEVNSVGFYFVAYIPRSVKRYEQVKNLLQEGILQGFSKCGWAVDWELHYKEDGTFDYELVKEMKLLSVSLVTDPANAVAFENVQEVQNALRYENKIHEDMDDDTFESLFK